MERKIDRSSLLKEGEILIKRGEFGIKYMTAIILITNHSYPSYKMQLWGSIAGN